MEEVKKAIKSLKNNRSAVLGGTQINWLSKAREKLFYIIHEMFQRVLVGRNSNQYVRKPTLRRFSRNGIWIKVKIVLCQKFHKSKLYRILQKCITGRIGKEQNWIYSRVFMYRSHSYIRVAYWKIIEKHVLPLSWWQGR